MHLKGVLINFKAGGDVLSCAIDALGAISSAEMIMKR